MAQINFDKKEIIILVAILVMLILSVALGFLHFSANFGLGITQ